MLKENDVPEINQQKSSIILEWLNIDTTLREKWIKKQPVNLAKEDVIGDLANSNSGGGDKNLNWYGFKKEWEEWTWMCFTIKENRRLKK